LYLLHAKLNYSSLLKSEKHQFKKNGVLA